jgi:hypothetical protein
MEDREGVLIYNDAMRVEGLCARRDFAKPEFRRMAGRPIRLFADTRAFVDTCIVRG